MLSERVRNIIVGLTMLAAVAALMVGIFLLGRFPRLHATPPYTITLYTSNASGLAAGNRVDFNGVQVGTVTDVRLSADMRVVEIPVSVDIHTNIPDNVLASIGKPQAGLGSSWVELTLPEAPASVTRAPGTAPRTFFVPPGPPLPKNGTARLYATPADTGLIPKSVLDQLTSVGKELQRLLETKTLAEFEKEDPNTRVANVSILVQRLDRVAKGVDTMIGDPKVQEQFRQIMANLEGASAQLKEIMKDARTTVAKVNTTVDEFGTAARSVGGAATQASKTMETTREEILKVSLRLADVLKSIEETTDKIAKGEGTAGRLVNDPRLYDGLVDLSKSLKSTTDDLNVLVRKWREEGLKLNLK